MNAQNNNVKNTFEMIEKIDNFKADIDLVKFAIESNPLAEANENISAEKARLTNINRLNRCKRLNKIQKLNDSALMFLSGNTTPDKIETTAIYAVDKMIELSKFMTGDSSVYGAGRNNSLLYLLHAIDTLPETATIETKAMSALVNAYGQPLESAQTQTSSGLAALRAFGMLSGSNGKYKREKSELLEELLKRFGKSTRRALNV